MHRNQQEDEERRRLLSMGSSGSESSDEKEQSEQHRSLFDQATTGNRSDEGLGDTKISAKESKVLSGRAAAKRKTIKEKGPSRKAARGRSTRAKKPKDMPKRPLSAYNLFFKEERARMLEDSTAAAAAASSSAAPQGIDESTEASGKVSFERMAKTVGKKWKVLPETDKERFQLLAAKDMERYREEMEDYNKNLALKTRQEREEATRSMHEIKARQTQTEAPSLEMGSGFDFSLGGGMTQSSFRDPLIGYPFTGLPFAGGAMQAGQAGVSQQFGGSHFRPFQTPQPPFVASQMQLGSNIGVDSNYTGLGIPQLRQPTFMGSQFGQQDTFLNSDILAQSRMNLLGMVPPNVQHEWLIRAAAGESARRNIGFNFGGVSTNMGMMQLGSDLAAAANATNPTGRDDGSGSGHHSDARRDPSLPGARDPPNFDRPFYYPP